MAAHLLAGRLELVRMVGKVGYQITKERLTRPHPTHLRDVPPSAEALTPAWLTAALCDGVPGAEVVSYELGARNDGTSARRTVRVTYNAAGREAELPEALFTKSGPTFLTRMVGAGVAGPDSDAGSGRAGHRHPGRPARPVLGGAAQPDVRQLAAGRLRVRRDPQRRDRREGPHRHRLRPGAPRHPAPVLRPPLRGPSGADAVAAAQRRRRPQTFLHGDVHPGNWYVTADDRMGLYDWQLAGRGGPARDLAYALTTHLPVETRREWERDLLDRYLDRLDRHLDDAGVKADLTRAGLFLGYRQQVCYAMLAWLATIGRSPLQPKYQPDEISLANLERITQAFADLETLEAVGH